MFLLEDNVLLSIKELAQQGLKLSIQNLIMLKETFVSREFSLSDFNESD